MLISFSANNSSHHRKPFISHFFHTYIIVTNFFEKAYWYYRVVPVIFIVACFISLIPAVKYTYPTSQVMVPAKNYGSLNAADDASIFATIK